MTVQELIDKLQKVEDKAKPIKVVSLYETNEAALESGLQVALELIIKNKER